VLPLGSYTFSQSIGGTGVSPVQAQAKACGYHKLLFDCDSVLYQVAVKQVRLLQNSLLTTIVILSAAKNLVFSNGWDPSLRSG
jgi:hypothetical protein